MAFYASNKFPMCTAQDPLNATLQLKSALQEVPLVVSIISENTVCTGAI